MVKFDEYKDKISKLAKESPVADYRNKSEEEIKKAEAAGIDMSNVKEIVKLYPAFDSVLLRVRQPDHFDFQFRIKREDLDSEEALDAFAAMFAGFAEMGGTWENEESDS